MKLLERLSTPFLLRRLVRSNERIATALEDLVVIQCRLHGYPFRPSVADDPTEGAEVEYSTDVSSWLSEEDERKREAAR